MKFNSAIVALSLPLLAVADCELALRWTKNWIDGALRRYQVQMITTPRNDSWANMYGVMAVNIGQGCSNVQWYWTDGMLVIDVSCVQGSAGHEYATTPFKSKLT